MASDIDFILISWCVGQVMPSTSIVGGGSSLAAAARVREEGTQLVFFPKPAGRIFIFFFKQEATRSRRARTGADYHRLTISDFLHR
jgi:hypothetical protein